MSVLLAYRILALGYSLSVLYIAISLAKGPFFKYLTHWGVVMVVGYFLVAVWSHFSKALTRTVTVVYVSTWAVQFLISVVFWTWISPTIKFDIPPFFNYSAHAGLLLAMVVELPFNSVQFQFRDMRFSLGLLLIYQILNVYFTLTTGPVYPGLNYSSASSAILIGYSVAVYAGSYYVGVVATKRRGKEKEE